VLTEGMATEGDGAELDSRADPGPVRPCCTNPASESSRETGVGAGGHEQAHPPTCKTGNRPTGNEALKRRGALTIRFDPAMTREAVPDFSTLGRRRKTLKVNIPCQGSQGPLHLPVGSAAILALRRFPAAAGWGWKGIAGKRSFGHGPVHRRRRLAFPGLPPRWADPRRARG
jgi:hypothetical protein